MTHGDKIKRQILDAGLEIWRDRPSDLSARRIAGKLQMTHGSVHYHFGNAASLRNAIAKHAIEVGDARVIAMLVAEKHPIAFIMLSETQRKDYLASL